MKLAFILVTYLTIIISFNVGDFEKYDKYVWRAMLDFKDKNYEKSLINFEQAFKTIPDENVSDYFYAAAAALNLNQNEKAKDLIIAAVKKTNASKNYFNSFKEFNPFREKKLFSEIKTHYDKYISDFYSGLKYPQIYREVDSLMEVDQKMRTSGYKWNEISRVDSLNIKRLIEITKEYGWQKKGWLILWHQRGTYGQRNYVWDFFKPYIDEQITKGKIRKDFWAIYEEEKSIIKNKKLIYGLYSSQFKEFPLIDVEKVDGRRKEIGQPPLWYMAKIYGIELPPGYKKTANDTFLD